MENTRFAKDYSIHYHWGPDADDHYIKGRFLTLKEAWTQLFSHPLDEIFMNRIYGQPYGQAQSLAIYHRSTKAPLLKVFSDIGDRTRILLALGPEIWTFGHGYGEGLSAVLPALPHPAPLLLATVDPDAATLQPEKVYLHLSSAALQHFHNAQPLVSQLPFQVNYSIRPTGKTKQPATNERHYFPTMCQALTALMTAPLLNLPIYHLLPKNKIRMEDISLYQDRNSDRLAWLDLTGGSADLCVPRALVHLVQNSGIDLSSFDGYDPKGKSLHLGSVGRSFPPNIAPNRSLLNFAKASEGLPPHNWHARLPQWIYKVSYRKPADSPSRSSNTDWVCAHECSAVSALQRLLATDLTVMLDQPFGPGPTPHITIRGGNTQASLKADNFSFSSDGLVTSSQFELLTAPNFKAQLPGPIRQLLPEGYFEVAHFFQGDLQWTAAAITLRTHLHEYNYRQQQITQMALPGSMERLESSGGAYLLEIIRLPASYHRRELSPPPVIRRLRVDHFDRALTAMMNLVPSWFRLGDLDFQGTFSPVSAINLYGPNRLLPLARVVLDDFNHGQGPPHLELQIGQKDLDPYEQQVVTGVQKGWPPLRDGTYLTLRDHLEDWSNSTNLTSAATRLQIIRSQGPRAGKGRQP